jgi:hypothetical protein
MALIEAFVVVMALVALSIGVIGGVLVATYVLACEAIALVGRRETVPQGRVVSISEFRRPTAVRTAPRVATRSAEGSDRARAA